jgi:long-chain acyl-CoA synthetase
MQQPSAPDIDVSAVLAELPHRISDVIAPWTRHCPDQLALVEASGAWTYEELATAVVEAKNWLATLGVRSGDRVMIVFENCRAFVAIFLALSELDAWPVLVNARLSASEVSQIREHCGPRLGIFTSSVSPHASAHAKRHRAVVEEPPMLGPISVVLLDKDAEAEVVDENVADNLAALIYTSGTTGTPKGVMLTHRNLLFVATISARIRALGPEDRIYGILPMSHSVGLSVVLLGALISGSTLYLAPRFDPVAALAALEKSRLTIMLGVPAMFALLVEYAKAKGFDSIEFPALRIISSSGAPLDAKLKATVESFFGQTLYNGYGMTECSPNIAQARVEEPRKDTSVGRIFPGMEVKFAGADGQTVAAGEVGELWVRGPNVMKGYYRAPEETAAAIDAQGWFNTRDLARLDGEHLFIVGRTKDLIVRFGFNVYPAELEAVLNAHPAVRRSAVIGRTAQGAEGGGEEIVAFVQPQLDSSLTVAALVEHAAQNLVPYKRPSHFIILPELPLTASGKVMKDQLGKMVAKAAAR